MSNTGDYRAAWVPEDDPYRDWNDAAAPAVAWIEKEARDQGKHAVLVTNTFNGATFDTPLARYTRPHHHFTPQGTRPSMRSVPVVAFVPDMRTLEFAIRLAGNSSLCIIETSSDPVSGWAAVTGAVNLLTGEHAKLDATVAKHIDRLAWYGNNGYGDSFGKKNAGHALDDLAEAGVTDPGFIVSALAAKRISLNGQENIRKLIGRR